MTLTPLHRLLLPLALVPLLGAGLALTGARPAAAHDALALAVPAADETVTSELAAVALTFSETPLAEFANAIALNVTGPTGASVTTGDPSADGTTLTVPVEITEQGQHTVTWQSVSSDGHTISGTYAFSYAGPLAAPEPAPTATVPAAVAPSAEATGPASSAPTHSPTEEPTSNVVPWIAGVTAFVALMLIPLIVVRVLRARRHRRAEAAVPEDTEGIEE
jgi:methionine-rich copper-binding protein CopC